MARWWSEPLDVAKHRDFMSTSHIGGIQIELVKDRLIEQRVYFVEVSGFTFQFVSVEQIHAAIAYFEERIHRSSKRPDVSMEHYWQSWFERLPQWLSEEPKRVKVISALSKAIAEFE